MSPERKKYSFDIVKMVAVIIVTGLSTWFATQMAIQKQFSDLKEELHVYINEEKTISKVTAADIENVKLDMKDHINKVNELDKIVFAMMENYRKQIKKEDE